MTDWTEISLIVLVLALALLCGGEIICDTMVRVEQEKTRQLELKLKYGQGELG